MANFVAIPVGQGDAFYLRRDDGHTVLVDGGRSRTGFSALFRESVCADHVDVVVCTHNDADHANGVLGFIEFGRNCGELWLPGRWLQALPQILQPGEEVFQQLAEQVSVIKSLSDDEHQAGMTPLERYCKSLGSNSYKIEDAEKYSSEPIDWPKDLLDGLERADAWWGDSLDYIRRHLMAHFYQYDPYFLHRFPRRLDKGQWELLLDAIDAAGRIRSIALAAFHRGIPVRWFAYNIKNPSGGEPWLKPVNARGIATVQSGQAGSLLSLLALTTSNKESLVFWSPPGNGKHPGVLFCADSDLDQVSLPQDIENALVTAPHHGSENNKNAYTVITHAVNGKGASLIWVRSDGRYRSRPGPSFLKEKGRKFCTLCRNSSSEKRSVWLCSSNGSWLAGHGTHPCQCQ